MAVAAVAATSAAPAARSGAGRGWAGPRAPGLMAVRRGLAALSRCHGAAGTLLGDRRLSPAAAAEVTSVGGVMESIRMKGMRSAMHSTEVAPRAPSHRPVASVKCKRYNVLT